MIILCYWSLWPKHCMTISGASLWVCAYALHVVVVRHTVMQSLHVSEQAYVCVSHSVDLKPQEKRRTPHHRSILHSPSNSHTPSRPPPSPPSSSSSSSSSVCAAGSCPLAATVSVTGVYSLQSPSLSTLLPSLQALPQPGLLSKLSPLLLQGLSPATNTAASPPQDWI